MARLNETKAQFSARAKKKNPRVTKQQLNQRWKQHLDASNARSSKAVTVVGRRGQREVIPLTQRMRRPILKANNKLPINVSRIVRMIAECGAPAVRVDSQLGSCMETAIFSVMQVFEITTSTDSDNTGRFAVLCCPRLGQPETLPTGIQDIDTYANYIVKPASAWPTTNWRTESNFEQTTVGESSVKTVDNANILCRPPESRAVVGSGGTTSEDVPWGTAPTTSANEPPSFDPVMTDETTYSKLALPEGQWTIAFQIVGTTLTAIDLTMSGTGSRSGYKQSITGTTIATAYCQVKIEDPSTDWVQFTATAGDVTSATVTINSYLNKPITDGGLMRTVRPLSMQVLASPADSLFDRGGELSIGLLTQNVLREQVLSYNSSPDPGNPLFWDQLGKYKPDENVAINEFKTGGYAYWMPQDVNNFELVTPIEQALSDSPTICVSGIYRVSEGGDSGGKVALRIRVWRTFEYTTNSQVTELAKPDVSFDEWVAASRFLARFPKATGNHNHEELFASINSYLDEGFQVGNKLISQYGPMLLRGKQLLGSLMI